MPDRPSEDSLSAVAWALLKGNTTGTLATFSSKHAGFPFASVTTFSVSPTGDLNFFFSSMARHSKNLRSNPNASLLVTAAAGSNQDSALASGRVSVIGRVKPIDAAELESVARSYLTANPEAKQWATFGDFEFFKMDVVDVYVVAGFGAMGWVDQAMLAAKFLPNV